MSARTGVPDSAQAVDPRLCEERAGLDQIFNAARARPPRRIAVVQPVDRLSLEGVLGMARDGLVQAILVGDQRRIKAALGDVLGTAGIDVLGSNAIDVDFVEAPDDAAAAKAAVDLVRSGAADVLMKGHIHSDDFLRPALDPQRGLRTGRRMSHIFVCCLPVSIYSKPLFVTDGAFNIAPDLGTKRDIAQNAIDLARALGIERPKVAVLAATEVALESMPTTRDAAELSALARSGEIRDGEVDGPFAFDVAISTEAARIKKIDSAVAGSADVLLVPTIEAGNILYKTLVHFCGAIAPGIIVGGAAPIILTSRADPVRAREASVALASVVARNA